MEPAAAEWKTQFRRRVAHLVVNCRTAGNLLAAARPYIERPIHTADAAAASANITAALETLSSAHGAFTVVGMFILTARLLALRGGSPDPAQPLLSIKELADTDAAARTAMSKLEVVFPFADDGCELIDWCRGVLAVIYRLLDHPLLPDVDDLIDTEQAEALRLLNRAAQMLQACAMAATSAFKDVSGPW